MGETKALATFDSNECEVIRRALKRYMLEHRKGVPTLHAEVVEADEPRAREINFKTFQRFVSGEVASTNDLVVTLSYNFVKDLPYYNDESELAYFGASVFNFLHPRVGAEKVEKIREQLAETLGGEFAIREAPAKPDEHGGLLRPPFGSLAGSKKSGTITFSDAGGQAYLRALEIRNPTYRVAGSPKRRNTYEGVVIAVGPRFYVYLRDCLTRMPKSYVLMWAADVQDGRRAAMAFAGDSFGADTALAQELVHPNYRHNRVRLTEEGGGKPSLGSVSEEIN